MTWLRRTTLILTLTLSACGGAQYASDCTWRGERVPPRQVPRGETPHADFEAMRPYRSYLRVLEEQPYAHRFQAYMRCLEPISNTYVLRPGSQHIVLEGGMWGGVPGIENPDLPAEFEFVRDQIRAHTDDCPSDLVVTYLGAYSTITFEEWVLLQDAGPVNRRLAYRVLRRLRLDEDGHVLSEGPSEVGLTMPCLGGHCGTPSRWLTEEASVGPRLSSGELSGEDLMTLFRTPSPETTPLPSPIEPERLLPEIEQRLALDFTVRLQHLDPDAENQQTAEAHQVIFEMTPAQLLQGVSQTLQEVIDGETIELRLQARATEAGEHGTDARESALELSLELTIMARGQTQSITVPGRSVALIDGDRVTLADPIFEHGHHRFDLDDRTFIGIYPPGRPQVQFRLPGEAAFR